MNPIDVHPGDHVLVATQRGGPAVVLTEPQHDTCTDHWFVLVRWPDGSVGARTTDRLAPHDPTKP